MLHKQHVLSKKYKLLPSFPPNTYDSFIGLLREQLSEDLSFKAGHLNKMLTSKINDRRDPVTDDVRRDRAIDKWLNRELVNKDTNIRIMFSDETDFLFLNDRGFPVSARDVIEWSRVQLTRLLGETVPWEALRGSFSGGASTSLKRSAGMVPRKYQDGKDITHHALRVYGLLTHSAWVMPRDLELVEGNVMFTVPKTAEIDRVACKEPELNMYCQKAIGDFIRRKLKTVGIDLNDQSVNQGLAIQGAIDGSLATIDLSSASDSVTKQLVIELLPYEWSELLMDLRSPKTYVRGEWHANNMIASMGNGYTFELESLIFWILVRACMYFTHTSGSMSVYGDDIICPVGLRDSVESTLSFFGFDINESKSFWSGPFRESCGMHWHSEEGDVTPFYVKNVPVSVTDWIHILNSLRKWASWGRERICDPRYYDLWSLFSELIPEPVKGSWDVARKEALVRHGRRNIAVIRPILRSDHRMTDKYQYGSYVRWLDTTETRREPPTLAAEDPFSYEGPLQLRRLKVQKDTRHLPVFPQEYET
ncbi:MAG: putative replicase protein [Yuhrihovirus faecenecus]|uniref:RNA-directed RNA polymerase n=1 Tax=Leviviridae sp. TaxID=2027243 RepID=A0ABY3STB2_9VIRU|nr:MAG: putative replicase protein [Leviviridae sp.]